MPCAAGALGSAPGTAQAGSTAPASGQVGPGGGMGVGVSPLRTPTWGGLSGCRWGSPCRAVPLGFSRCCQLRGRCWGYRGVPPECPFPSSELRVGGQIPIPWGSPGGHRAPRPQCAPAVPPRVAVGCRRGGMEGCGPWGAALRCTSVSPKAPQRGLSPTHTPGRPTAPGQQDPPQPSGNPHGTAVAHSGVEVSALHAPPTPQAAPHPAAMTSYRQELEKYRDIDEDKILQELSAEELEQLDTELLEMDPEVRPGVGTAQDMGGGRAGGAAAAPMGVPRCFPRTCCCRRGCGSGIRHRRARRDRWTARRCCSTWRNRRWRPRSARTWCHSLGRRKVGGHRGGTGHRSTRYI